jgi:hypothetical protein
VSLRRHPNPLEPTMNDFLSPIQIACVLMLALGAPAYAVLRL